MRSESSYKEARMKEAGDVMERVKRETRAQHERIEKLVPIGKEVLSLSSYRSVLSSFLGLFEPIEHLLGSLPLSPDLQFSSRKRAHLLLSDLLSLGLTEEMVKSLPRCSDLIAPSSESEAIGVMYVLEGSTLGGKMISRIVHEQLGLTEESGCSFFASSGRDAAALWQVFGEVVRKKISTPQNEQEFIRAAQSTFSCFERWLMHELAY
jgi:heme oxygenase